MSPIPSPGARFAAQFVQATASKSTPLRDALETLALGPVDKRIERKVYNAVRAAIVSQLAGKTDYDTAQTIAQDTALRVFKAAKDGKPLTVAFVRSCARNLLVDHVRGATSLKRDSSSFVPDASTGWDKPIEHVELLERLAELPRDTGNVLALRFLEDMTLQQVSDTLGVSISTVHRLEKLGLRQMESFLAA